VQTALKPLVNRSVNWAVNLIQPTVISPYCAEILGSNLACSKNLFSSDEDLL
jgi:hypothetical protein